MKNKIKNLKQRIETNYERLNEGYGDNKELADHVLKIIDLLIVQNVSDDKIKIYLNDISTAIEILEEKLTRIEKKSC